MDNIKLDFQKHIDAGRCNGVEWIIAKITTPEPVAEPEPTYQEKRLAAYGSPHEQLEFITEKGLTAWKSHVAEIKKQYPKE